MRIPLLAAAALLAPAPALADVIVKTTAPGAEAQIGRHSSIKPDCGAGVLKVSVKTPPKNGKVDIRDGSHAITANPNAKVTQTCAGKTTPHKLVVYVPNAGFTGADSFEYIVDIGQPKTNEVRITVK